MLEIKAIITLTDLVLEEITRRYFFTPFLAPVLADSRDKPAEECSYQHNGVLKGGLGVAEEATGFQAGWFFFFFQRRGLE